MSMIERKVHAIQEQMVRTTLAPLNLLQRQVQDIYDRIENPDYNVRGYLEQALGDSLLSGPDRLAVEAYLHLLDQLAPRNTSWRGPAGLGWRDWHRLLAGDQHLRLAFSRTAVRESRVRVATPWPRLAVALALGMAQGELLSFRDDLREIANNEAIHPLVRSAAESLIKGDPVTNLVSLSAARGRVEVEGDRLLLDGAGIGEPLAGGKRKFALRVLAAAPLPVAYSELASLAKGYRTLAGRLCDEYPFVFQKVNLPGPRKPRGLVVRPGLAVSHSGPRR